MNDTERHIDAVPLSRAMLCCNCDCITAARDHCPVCGGEALIALSRVLNRETEEAA